MPKPAALRLEEGDQRINDFGWYTIVGEVVNTGSDDLLLLLFLNR
jgi:hypothetical protein